MLRRSRLRRETSLITEAMRHSPRPVPPSGLKDRLIAEALASVGEAHRQPVHSRAWLAWAVPATAVAVIAAWLIWSSMKPAPQTLVHKPAAPSPSVIAPQTPPKPEMTADSAQPEMHPSPKRTSVRRNTMAVAPVRVRHEAPVRRFRHRPLMATKPDIKPSERIETEAPPMQVTVGRAKEGGTGYARASVWSTDPSGNAVRTQWAVIHDPTTDTSREELSVSDAAGRSQSVTVTVADDKI